MNKEAQASLLKARSKLEDALELEVDDFPGLVINSSYYAMHHAAVAMLQEELGDAPIRLGEVVKAFAKLLSEKYPDATEYGENLNRAFDARVAEDYGVLEAADVDEAREISEEAEAFVEFCERHLDMSDPAQTKLFG